MSRTAEHCAPALGGFLLTQRHRGACTQDTAELFFDSGGLAGRAARKRQEQAKAICRLCPILHGCRAYARADPTLDGIWGGETEEERRTARRLTPGPDLPAGDNQQGRRLAGLAAQLAHRDGLDAAAKALKVPPATLRRVLVLYGLDQPPDPAGPPASAKGGEPPWPPPGRRATSTSTTTSSPQASRSRSSSPSRAGPSPGPAAPTSQTTPTTPATRPI
jgi:WhiB family transcriptional regulator, redox-sensing transcriptional regulator